MIDTQQIAREFNKDEYVEQLRAECNELLVALQDLVTAADYDNQDSGWYSEQSIKALEKANAVLAKALEWHLNERISQ